LRDDIRQEMWLHKRGKKRPHWAILTLDDLDQTNEKHSQLIAKLQEEYQAAKKSGKDKPNPKSNNISI